MRGFGRLAAMAAASMALAGAPLIGSGYGPRNTRPSGWRTIHHLNRSQKWKRARTYAEARALSPYPDRPVR